MPETNMASSNMDSISSKKSDNSSADPTSTEKNLVNGSSLDKDTVSGEVTTSSGPPGIDPSDKVSLANHEITTLLLQNKITKKEVTTLQAVLHENVALKEKTQKLKNLLGRSAKAQSDLKNECNTNKWKLEQAQKAIEKMNARMDQLNNRPTHMDILADFEANFDRALLSMGGPNLEDEDDFTTSDGQIKQQSGGQNPSAAYEMNQSNALTAKEQYENEQTLLDDLASTQNRIQHQESLNKTLLSRAAKLEKHIETQSRQISALAAKNDNLTLELRMSKIETTRIQNKMKDKAIALTEMQMEIDLVTKASVEANARASASMEVVKSIKSDKNYVDELEAKVDALQEWALASAEAKRLTTERANELEKKLKAYHDMLEEDGMGVNSAGSGAVSNGVRGGGVSSSEGRKLWTKSSSKVVGAGMDATYILPLGDCELAKNEMVVLRWKFDIIPGELDIDFSILKGKYEENKNRAGADYLIKERTVLGGAGGEVSGAFAVQNACTLVFSNMRSWVRPRAIKFSCEACAINI